MSLYYRPSNQMPPGGGATAVAGGAAAAVALAFGYGFLTWYVPFTSIFMFLVFGGLLGAALAALVRRGKLRSPAAVTRRALLVGLVAMYAQWSVYLTLRAGFVPPRRHHGVAVRTSGRFRPGVWAGLVASPARMGQAMHAVTGLSIDDSPLEFSWYLLVIWGAEALIIVGMATASARSQAGEPFSEATDVWATPEIMPRPVMHVRDLPAMKAALEAGQYHVLVPIPTKVTARQMLSRPPASFARLTLYSAPHDPGCAYLKLENFIGKRRKGVAFFDIKTVVERLHLTPAAYQELCQRFAAQPVNSPPPTAPAPNAA